VYPGKEGLDRPLSRHFQSRGDIRERLQHEGSFVEPRVRDVQAGLVDLGVPVDEEIEVERARPLRRNALTHAPEPLLDGEQDGEEVAGGQLGLQRDDAVQEARLVDVPHRRGVDERRDGDYADPRCRRERLDGGVERCLTLAEVRAERDVGGSHGARVRSPLPLRRFLLVLIAALCASGAAAAASAPDWWIQDVGADQATPPGPGVPIAIVDSGVDPTQPLFAGRAHTTFLNEQTVNGQAEYHGTAVASVALSVYPQAELEAWDASPTGVILDFTAAAGISTVAEHCPAVINLSFGNSNVDPILEDAVLEAQRKGCLVVAAAGNGGLNGNPTTFPAGYPHVLTVGASDQNDQVAAFSTAGGGIDLSAPGVGMSASVPLSHDPSGTSTGLAGTSFSAPIVSAAAAWIWTVRPTLDAEQVAAVLRETARDIGAPGFDPGSGFGIVNIPAALAAPTPPPDPREPNDDISEVKPGALFTAGQPALTTPAHIANGIAASLEQTEDPVDVYRVWVPPHRVVRASVASDGTAAARIWGPDTESVDENILLRRRDLKGSSIRGGAKGSFAYVEVALTGASTASSYILKVTASTR
jgi:Subtilase family